MVTITKEIANLVSPMFDGKDMVENIGILKTAFSDYGFFSEEGYKAIENFFLDQEIIKTPIGDENVIDMTYVNNAKEAFSSLTSIKDFVKEK